jgi:hypothetical protein
VDSKKLIHPRPLKGTPFLKPGTAVGTGFSARPFHGEAIWNLVEGISFDSIEKDKNIKMGVY